MATQNLTPPTRTPLAQDFSAVGAPDWLALVETALGGADFEKRLVSHTSDGIRVAPLYTRADELSGSAGAQPGASPFTRGFDAKVSGGGWDVRQLHAGPEPEAANGAILSDLNAGVSSITLQMAAPGQSGIGGGAQALETTLKDVRLDWAPIAFAPGTNFSAVLKDVDAVISERGFEKSRIDCALGADPLGELARLGTLPVSLDELFLQLGIDFKFAREHYPKMRVLLVDGRPYFEAGATQGQELAALCAGLVASARRLETGGLSPADVISRTAFALTSEPDIFLTIAKLRAARRLIARIGEQTGAGDAVSKVHITASTSIRMMTRRDPWTNLIRLTTACAAAALGGADAITVLPFTWALGRPDGFAMRTARNIQMVCQEESSLGRVIDPAGGSWYVEKLTDELASTAWAQFQQIESEGGLEAALASGALQNRIAEVAAARAKRIATGEEPLTGTSTFPILGDDGVRVEPHVDVAAPTTPNMIRPLTPHRLSEPFEALRDRADAVESSSGARPKVFLASIGSIKDHSARSTWVKNLMAAGGIEALAGDGFENADDAVRAFRDSGTAVACICSSDALYAQHAVAMLGGLRSAGATHVYLAGRPGELVADLESAGLSGCLFAGQDAVEELTKLHDALKVSAE